MESIVCMCIQTLETRRRYPHATSIRPVYIRNSRRRLVRQERAALRVCPWLEDLRQPVYDIREVSDAVEHISNLPAALQKERVLSEDPKWNDMLYVLAFCKTQACKKPPRMCRQGYARPFYHKCKDRRRNPHLCRYRSTPCPQVKPSGDEWKDSNNCDSEDNCVYCHTRTEQQFHAEDSSDCNCKRETNTSGNYLRPFVSNNNDSQSGHPVNSRKSVETISNRTLSGLRNLHRTSSLSMDKRHRPLSLSISASNTPNTTASSTPLTNRSYVGIIAGLDTTIGHSETGNLVRIKQSAHGQSVPNLASSHKCEGIIGRCVIWLYLGGDSKNSRNGTIAFWNGRTVCRELKPGHGTQAIQERVARGVGDRKADRGRRGRPRNGLRGFWTGSS